MLGSSVLTQEVKRFVFGKNVQALDSLLVHYRLQRHEITFVNELLPKIGRLVLPRENLAVL